MQGPPGRLRPFWAPEFPGPGSVCVEVERLGGQSAGHGLRISFQDRPAERLGPVATGRDGRRWMRGSAGAASGKVLLKWTGNREEVLSLEGMTYPAEFDRNIFHTHGMMSRF